MTVIGITGGVGCGKSAVLQFLKEEYKAVIVETDKLAHELEQKGNLCYNEIVSYFGREILDKDGIIDRKNLRKELRPWPKTAVRSIGKAKKCAAPIGLFKIAP